MLIAFILIAIAASVFAVYQRNNIQALLYAGKYSEEELEEKNQEINSRIKTVMEQMQGFSSEPLSEEELQKLTSSDISPEEALAIITGKNKGGINEDEKSGETKSKVDTAKINGIIAEVYSLKATYLGRIDGLLAQGLAEWKATPHEERTLTRKLTLAEKYMARGSALEAECDGRMSGILARLEAELSAAGESTAIVSEISSLYNQEKAVKKAALLGAYYPG